MRIDDVHRLAVELQRTSARPLERAEKPGASAVPPSADNESETRAERVQRVKELFRSGKPLDMQRLADRLLETGIFFDEKV